MNEKRLKNSINKQSAFYPLYLFSPSYAVYSTIQNPSPMLLPGTKNDCLGMVDWDLKLTIFFRRFLSYFVNRSFKCPLAIYGRVELRLYYRTVREILVVCSAGGCGRSFIYVILFRRILWKKGSKAEDVTEHYLTTVTRVVEDNTKMHFKE